ncbi:dihydrodipicolinate synthase family protein [Rhodoferax ferrireducens]|uniref:dihydrodipicolinate synthase family protein n=1 Tax=Rhodoferax ferrireducens TaxID=192843 RepID=UPI000E0DE52E|nr:dihydrodipicolinate synthase family protein [Rhodoferax ferrireducens]
MNTPQIPYQGIWPALLTPLTADLAIDIPSFARHACSLIDAGCTGVTPFGTTGEGPSFSVAERIAAVDGLIAGGVPAGRILVSTSCAALPDAVELTRHATQAGAFGSLLLPPFFLKGVSDQGVIDAYRWVIDQVADPRLRIVLYHIPQVSGVPLSHHVIETLKTLYPKTIIGIKDSSGQREGSLAFAKAFMPPLQVWVGNEPDLQVMAARGSVGAVSGVANVLPHLLQRLVGQFDGPDAARDLQRVKDFIGILGGYGVTAAFKGIMAILTQDPGWRRVRPPLVALTDAEYQHLVAQMNAFALDPSKD